MNPEFSSVSSSTIESIRKAGIGRRGGVKVRGGRLPPVQIHNVLSKKKSIAPKIPQKRSEVKKEKIDKEAFDELPFRGETKFREQRDRGRGRGRGARVYIQTEGTLFGEGMIFKPKLERHFSDNERSSGSRSRASIKAEKKFTPEELDSLLESYDYSDENSDEENDLKPVKYPLVKEKLEIKKEIKPEIKKEVKDEGYQDLKNIDIDAVVKSIKVEPVDDDENEIKAKPCVSKFFTPIEAVTFSAENELVTDLKNLKSDEGIMLLLQFPSCFPFDKYNDNLKTSDGKKQTPSTTSKEKTVDDQNAVTRIKSNIRDIPEGFIGKLQFLKSGKIRLVMGSIQFYLENGSSRQGTASAVSISLNGNKGDLLVLGKIERKMLFRPHFNGITDEIA